MTAKTSDRMSRIAARYMDLTPARLIALTAKPSTTEIAVEEIRSMAASLLRQDEVKGVRRLLRLVTG